MWPDDWDPPAIIARGGQARPPAPNKCGNYALSFFRSAKHAQKRLKNLDRGYDIAAFYGTHAAEVRVERTDGRCTVPSRRYGHTDLHEYEGDHDWPNRIDSLTSMFPLD